MTVIRERRKAMKEKKFEALKTENNALEIKNLEAVAGGVSAEDTFVENCPFDCGFYIIYHEPGARWIVDKEMKAHLEYCHGVLTK